jgi:phage terminase large subunit GpA-like protein
MEKKSYQSHPTAIAGLRSSIRKTVATFRPPPKLTVSEWADKYRRLSSEDSSEAGKWVTARYEYQRGIMDAFCDPKVKAVVGMTSAQIGKTSVILNTLAYFTDQDPSPILVVQPTLTMAEAFSKDRLDPMIRDCPQLHRKIKQKKSRDSDNTILHKGFPGGHITIIGANSPASLASRPIRIVLADEVDKFDPKLDVVGKAVKRTARFWNRKIGMFCTPTVEGASRIAQAYDKSDQRKFFVPCPQCGHEQVLIWNQVKWDKDEHGVHLPRTAYYLCENKECGARWDDATRWRAVSRGRWIAANPESNVAGFHVWEGYATGTELSSIVQHFLDVKDYPASYREFVNETLGETWKERGEAPEYKRLYDRRETWKIGTVPTGGLFLTAGVDVQADRLEIQVKAFGRDKENWTVDYHVLDGRTAEDAVWEELTAFLNRTYKHESGIDLHIARVGVDSGFNTQQVYAWARKQGPGRIIVLKGQSSGAAALGTPTAVDVSSKGKRHKRGIKVWPVNVSMLKEELYGWLRLEKPSDELLANGSGYPAGYCHYPQFDEEFFKQLTAEELMVRVVKGYRVSEWQKTRDRNEALDTHNYARAAAAHVGIDRFNERDWRALEATFAESTTVEVFAQPPVESNDAPAPAPVPVPKPMPVAQPTAAPRPTQQPYQPIRSNWMNR